jgi:hypothetical protein
MPSIPEEYRGWWHIVETGTWGDEHLHALGPALLSLTGHGDRLRLCCLLAYVNARATKTGVSFRWEGAWEFDQLSGTGSARLRKDGCLAGRIRIKGDDDSTFVAEPAEAPDEPIPRPPSYGEKWGRR